MTTSSPDCSIIVYILSIDEIREKYGFTESFPNESWMESRISIREPCSEKWIVKSDGEIQIMKRNRE